MEEKNMLQKINRFIAANSIWIFLIAVTYKLTFYIINLVNGFEANAGLGVRRLFEGLLGAAWELIVLAVILEVSRKVASGYPPEQRVQPNPYNAPMPNQQQPRPAQQPQGGVAIWTCPNCGSQNNGAMAFCAKCGKPRS